MKRGILVVTPELVREAINMPQNHDIVGCEFDAIGRCLRLVIDGPDMPEVAEGEQFPLISAELTRIPERIDWKWRFPK